jgi:hypothetical protein
MGAPAAGTFRTTCGHAVGTAEYLEMPTEASKTARTRVVRPTSPRRSPARSASARPRSPRSATTASRGHCSTPRTTAPPSRSPRRTRLCRGSWSSRSRLRCTTQSPLSWCATTVSASRVPLTRGSRARDWRLSPRSSPWSATTAATPARSSDPRPAGPRTPPRLSSERRGVAVAHLATSRAPDSVSSPPLIPRPAWRRRRPRAGRPRPRRPPASGCAG